MKCILIKAGEKVEVIELPKEHSYKDIKKLLEIDSPIDCVERKIGKVYYDFWVDDEGLLKDGEKKVCGYLMDNRCRELLVGNILITHHDDEGNTTGLTDEEIEEILKGRYLIDMDMYNEFNGNSLDEDYDFGNGFVIKAHGSCIIYKL